MIKIRKYIFLLLILFVFMLIFSISISHNFYSELEKNNLVEINIIGEEFFKTYYIKFSNANEVDSFKIYDI